MEAFKKISDIEKHLKLIETVNKGTYFEFSKENYISKLFSQCNTLGLDKSIKDTYLSMFDLIRLDSIDLIKEKFNEFFNQFSNVDKELEYLQILSLAHHYVRMSSIETEKVLLKAKGFEIIEPQTNVESGVMLVYDLSKMNKKILKLNSYRYNYEQTNVLRKWLNDESIDLSKYITGQNINPENGSIKRFQNGNIEITHKNVNQELKQKLYELIKLENKKCHLAIKM